MRRSIILTAIALCACGQQDGSNETAASSSGVDRQASAAGADAGSSVIPDFPGSTPVEIPNFRAPGTDSRSGSTTARETDAGPEEVARFYRDHFRRTGMPVRADTATAAGGLISVGRDGGSGAMLTISRIGDRTRIAVMTSRVSP